MARRRAEIGRGGFDIVIDPGKTPSGGDDVERSGYEDLSHHDGNGGESKRDSTLGKPPPDQSIPSKGHSSAMPATAGGNTIGRSTRASMAAAPGKRRRASRGPEASPRATTMAIAIAVVAMLSPSA